MHQGVMHAGELRGVEAGEGHQVSAATGLFL